MRMLAVCDEKDALTGLSLLGVEGFLVDEANLFSQALVKVGMLKDAGIIIVSENLALQFSENLAAFRASHPQLIVIEIPGAIGSRRPADFLSQYIKDAIGVR